MEEKILKLFQEAAQAVLDCGKKNASLISQMGRELIACFERGGKLLIFGNGGSAAHSQHFAAELVNKLCTYRQPLPAIAINTDSSILTSIGNDNRSSMSWANSGLRYQPARQLAKRYLSGYLSGGFYFQLS